LIDRADAEVLPDERDALGTKPLDLEELERRWRELRQKLIAPLAGAALHDVLKHSGQALADAGDLGQFAFGIAKDILDALGVALHGSGAVAIAADTEAVFARDLHQIGRFVQQSRDFFVLQRIL